MKKIPSAKIVAAAALASAFVLVGVPAMASHSWNNYHWARTGAKISPPVGNNVGSQWTSYLTQAVYGSAGQAGWNTGWAGVTSYIYSDIEGGRTNPKNCKPVAGRIEVCSSTYGRTGWLGIAQIWLSNGHITQGITKLNDTYFAPNSQYDTPAWRRMVMCQEIGHDYGLGHVDETFQNGNQGTCMDYTNAPQGGIYNGFDYGLDNMFPNEHDFKQLATIYEHGPDGGAAAPARSEAAGGDTPGEWGRAIDYRTDGRPHVFEKITPTGARMITHVFWAHGEGPRGPHHH